MLAVTLARIALHRSFARAGAAGVARGWEHRFALGALVTGATWAYAPAVLFPVSGPLLQMAVVFVVGGSIIGAAGIYAASRLAFYAFAALPSVAIAAQLLLQPGRTYKLLGLTVVVFGVVMVRVYRDIHGAVVEAVRARLRNEELTQRLAGSEARLRDAIESFPDAMAVWDGEDRLVVCDEAYARLFGGGRRGRASWSARRSSRSRAMPTGPSGLPAMPGGRRTGSSGACASIARGPACCASFRRATGAGSRANRCAPCSAATSAWSPTSPISSARRTPISRCWPRRT